MRALSVGRTWGLAGVIHASGRWAQAHGKTARELRSEALSSSLAQLELPMPMGVSCASRAHPACCSAGTNGCSEIVRNRPTVVHTDNSCNASSYKGLGIDRWQDEAMQVIGTGVARAMWSSGVQVVAQPDSLDVLGDPTDPQYDC